MIYEFNIHRFIMEGILSDPVAFKVAMWIIGGTTTTLLAIISYFLKKSLGSIDRLNEIMQLLKEDFISYKMLSNNTAEDVSEIKTEIKEIKSEIAEIKLDVNKHEIIIKTRDDK